MNLELPAGYGQVIYDGYRKRAQARVGDDILVTPWGGLTPEDRECWDGAAADLEDYLARVPR